MEKRTLTPKSGLQEARTGSMRSGLELYDSHETHCSGRSCQTAAVQVEEKKEVSIRG